MTPKRHIDKILPLPQSRHNPANLFALRFFCQNKQQDTEVTTFSGVCLPTHLQSRDSPFIADQFSKGMLSLTCRLVTCPPTPPHPPRPRRPLFAPFPQEITPHHPPEPDPKPSARTSIETRNPLRKRPPAVRTPL